MNYPRILIISHSCLSKSGSNGRTLSNLVEGYPIECLAQFYIQKEIPDSSVCNNYFRVTDSEALLAFCLGKKVGRVISPSTIINDKEDVTPNALYKRFRNKSAFNYIVRNLVWNSNSWRSKSFSNWINEFDPEVVFLQIGDYSFIFKIALSIAKEKNIPLILYNGEDFYFKQLKFYMPFYQYYLKQFKKQFEKTLSYATHTIYSCEKIQKTYSKEFSHNSSVLMISTNITPSLDKKDNNPLVISYLGSLSNGRHESLIVIANTLQQIDNKLFLEVYGKYPNPKVENSIKNCKGIRYRGVVSYESVVKVMQLSDILIHTESFSDSYISTVKHGFSTKIADCLASGSCFFVYAPEEIACAKYLKDNNAAYVVSSKNDLSLSLKYLINDGNLRKSYLKNAMQLVVTRHNLEVNAENFKNIVFNICKKHEVTDENSSD